MLLLGLLALTVFGLAFLLPRRRRVPPLAARTSTRPTFLSCPENRLLICILRARVRVMLFQNNRPDR